MRRFALDRPLPILYTAANAAVSLLPESVCAIVRMRWPGFLLKPVRSAHASKQVRLLRVWGAL